MQTKMEIIIWPYEFVVECSAASPTTVSGAARMSVWNRGASADTSHWYSPLRRRCRFTMRTCWASDCVSCNTVRDVSPF